MPRINDEVKTFIVQQLAMYDTPSQVAAAVKEQFGIEMPREQVFFYDPTHGPKPAKKWCALFEETRKTFLDKAAEIGVANRSVRLRRLERMANKLEERGNIIGAAQLLAQAAKDAGGAFTNRRELTGKGGKPLARQVWIVGGKEIEF